MATFNTKSLQGAIKALKGIALKNRSEVQKGVLYKNSRLYAGNDEIGMVLPSDMSMFSEAFVIPYKAFDIIFALSSTEVDITLDGSKLIITSGKAKSNVQTHSVDSFVSPLFVCVI